MNATQRKTAIGRLIQKLSPEQQERLIFLLNKQLLLSEATMLDASIAANNLNLASIVDELRITRANA